MSSLSKFSTLFHTVRYLKPIQVYARVAQYIKKPVAVSPDWSLRFGLSPRHLTLKPSIPFPNSNKGNQFEFLNLTTDFGSHIDWNTLEHGRLWAYNLNYFEFLDQEDGSAGDGMRLIDDFMARLPERTVGLEPYPLSLRCINWIRFFVWHNIQNETYNAALYHQLELLSRQLEYHLLGNHLLENAFALLFGGCYFNDDRFYKKAKHILTGELKEQILADGAHFELSPMYHGTMLFRLLDCYNLMVSNTALDQKLTPLLKQTCEQMLGWLNRITFRNGRIPLMNDAAFGIAPETAALNNYASRLGLSIHTPISLSASGYRKFETEKFECALDVGNVGPDYQPGHAHADTFGFEWHVHGRPVLVDTGTSTYEINETRFFERSTAAHNTVVAAGKNSSEVWAGHRVARRARVTLHEDSASVVSASHDGYQRLGLVHSRRFELENETIIITDQLGAAGEAYFHFAPAEQFEIVDNEIIGQDYTIRFSGAKRIELRDSHYAPEFNKRIKSKAVCIHFHDQLTTLLQ